MDAAWKDAKRIIKEAGEDLDLLLREAAQNISAFHGASPCNVLLFEPDEEPDEDATPEHWDHAQKQIAEARRQMPLQATDEDPEPIL
jgi:hypothetical protein